MQKTALIIVVISLAAMSLACSLAGQSASEPTDANTEVLSSMPIATATMQLTITTTTPVVSTNPQTASESDLSLVADDTSIALDPAVELEDAGALQDLEAQLYMSNCAPRSDWPVYVVVRGDTLSNIARRNNTTWRVLADANCLANPNLIYVGQILRVPSVPHLPDDNSDWPLIVYPVPASPSVCNAFALNPAETVPVYAGPGADYDIIASLLNYAPWLQSSGNFHQITFPNGGVGWISHYVSRLRGPCETDLPVFTNPGVPPTTGCSAVVPPGQTVTISTGAETIGYLGNFAPIVQYQHGQFEIALQGWDQVGWVWETEVNLYGDCPDYHQPTPAWTPTPHPLPESLPRIENPGIPPQDYCTVVINQGTPVLVYPGPLTVIGPIAVLENYAFFVNQLDAGYVISVSSDGREGWVSAAGTHLEGECPAPSEQ